MADSKTTRARFDFWSSEIMSTVITPELEVFQHANNSVRYLEHGWPSKHCRWHIHKQSELHYIVKSSGTSYIGDYIGEFNANSLYLIGSYLPHNWISTTNTNSIDTRDMILQFDNDSFDEHLFPEFHELQILFDKASRGIEFMDIDTKNCKRRFTQIKNSTGLERLNLTIDFLTFLCNHTEQKTLSLHNFHASKTINYHGMERSINYILENYNQDISIQTLAKFTNLSNSAYCRRFYKSMGVKFSEFLNKVRIAQACSLLYLTEQSIANICYDVGFQNLSNFNRQFLKFKHVAPSTYRKEIHCANQKNVN